MNYFTFFILCAALSAGALAAQTQTETPGPAVGQPQGTATVFVAKGTIVVVASAEAINSYAASPREPISYTVAQDVVVNGYLIAKAGDEADGQILEAQQGKLGFYGVGYKAADLRVSVDTVHNFCGDTIKMHFMRSEYRRRQGLFGSEKDIQIIDGQKYVAVTAFPQKVCGQATTESDPPVPSDALLGDKG